jgi:hypothetical protein
VEASRLVFGGLAIFFLHGCTRPAPVPAPPVASRRANAVEARPKVAPPPRAPTPTSAPEVPDACRGVEIVLDEVANKPECQALAPTRRPPPPKASLRLDLKPEPSTVAGGARVDVVIELVNVGDDRVSVDLPRSGLGGASLVLRIEELLGRDVTEPVLGERCGGLFGADPGEAEEEQVIRLGIEPRGIVRMRDSIPAAGYAEGCSYGALPPGSYRLWATLHLGGGADILGTTELTVTRGKHRRARPRRPDR